MFQTMLFAFYLAQLAHEDCVDQTIVAIVDNSRPDDSCMVENRSRWFCQQSRHLLMLLMLLLPAAAHWDSDSDAAVGSQSPRWTLVASLGSFSSLQSSSPPPSPPPQASSCPTPPLLTSFAPQRPSSPPFSYSRDPPTERWPTHARTQKPIFCRILQTSWTPSHQNPSDFCPEMWEKPS